MDGTFWVIVLYFNGVYPEGQKMRIESEKLHSVEPTDFDLPPHYTITAVIVTPDVDLTAVIAGGILVYGELE